MRYTTDSYNKVGACLVITVVNKIIKALTFFRSKFGACFDILFVSSSRAGLSLGSSKNWKEVLFAITGENKLDASALIEYFQPLYEFLIEDDEEPDDTLEIVVGCIIAFFVLILLYFLIKWCIKKSRE